VTGTSGMCFDEGLHFRNEGGSKFEDGMYKISHNINSEFFKPACNNVKFRLLNILIYSGCCKELPIIGEHGHKNSVIILTVNYSSKFHICSRNRS
jgi:hypothetical protein